jgi:hypothetical protein
VDQEGIPLNQNTTVAMTTVKTAVAAIASAIPSLISNPVCWSKTRELYPSFPISHIETTGFMHIGVFAMVAAQL